MRSIAAMLCVALAWSEQEVCQEPDPSSMLQGQKRGSSKHRQQSVLHLALESLERGDYSKLMQKFSSMLKAASSPQTAEQALLQRASLNQEVEIAMRELAALPTETKDRLIDKAFASTNLTNWYTSLPEVQRHTLLMSLKEAQVDTAMSHKSAAADFDRSHVAKNDKYDLDRTANEKKAPKDTDCPKFCGENTCSTEETCPWEPQEGKERMKDDDRDAFECCCVHRTSSDEDCGGSASAGAY